MRRVGSLHAPVHPVRFVTAASLVRRSRRGDQHHAADPAEPGRRGHPPRPRPLGREIVVTAAVQEDVQGVAVSLLPGRPRRVLRVPGRAARRARRRARAGVRRRRRRDRARGDRVLHERRRAGSSPPRTASGSGLAGDGQHAGPSCDIDLAGRRPGRRGAAAGRSTARSPGPSRAGRGRRCSRSPSCVGSDRPRVTVPVLGITGTGGSGKSSLTDELIRRLRLDQEDKLRIAVLAIDPTRRRGGGALLGDRIRMNASTVDPHGVLPVAGHPGRSRRGARAPAGHDRRVQGGRARPGDRRDARASARATPRSSSSSTCRCT